MKDKKQSRLRRARRARSKIRELDITRLCVFRTPRHIYAQVIQPAQGGDRVLASASSLDSNIRGKGGNTGNRSTAESVGSLLAERAKAAGVTRVAFDRSGFKYHGRVKALAEAVRAGGVEL